METLEKGLYLCILQNMFVATKTHQISIAVGLDKRVVVELVINETLDRPGVSFHLQKQHFLLIFKSFAAQSFGPFFWGLLPTSIQSTPSWKAVRVKGTAPTS